MLDLQSAPSLKLLHSVVESRASAASDQREVGARCLGDAAREQVVQLEHALGLVLSHELRQELIGLLGVCVDKVDFVAHDLAESVRELSAREGLGTGQVVRFVSVRMRVQQQLGCGDTDVFNGYGAIGTVSQGLGDESLGDVVFLAQVVFLDLRLVPCRAEVVMACTCTYLEGSHAQVSIGNARGFQFLLSDSEFASKCNGFVFLIYIVSH